MSQMKAILDNYLAIAESATEEQKIAALAWYPMANTIAEEITYIMADRAIDIDIEIASSIISAFSPRQLWSRNIAHAVEFAEGQTPKTLGNNVRMAESAMSNGFNALRGMKTNAFARAIAGDTEAVTIDVWMLKAAGLDRNDTNKSLYNLLSDAVRWVADEFGWTPRDMQALIWIVYRGAAQ